jgi:hypothetical protein
MGNGKGLSDSFQVFNGIRKFKYFSSFNFLGEKN